MEGVPLSNPDITDAEVRAVESVLRGDRLSIAWPVPSFTQVFVPASVPGRSDEVRVKWVGDRVAGIEPRGQYLPMYAGE